MFSTSGLRKGKKDPRFEAHIVWLKFRVIRGEAIIIFENVPGYPVSELIKALGDSYTIFLRSWIHDSLASVVPASASTVSCCTKRKQGGHAIYRLATFWKHYMHGLP
jgi:hypothetical protein